MTDISLDFLKLAAHHIAMALACKYPDMQDKQVSISLLFPDERRGVCFQVYSTPQRKHQNQSIASAPSFGKIMDVAKTGRLFVKGVEDLFFSQIASAKDLQDANIISMKEVIVLYDGIPTLQTAHDDMQTRAFCLKYLNLQMPSLIEGEQSLAR